MFQRFQPKFTPNCYAWALMYCTEMCVQSILYDPYSWPRPMGRTICRKYGISPIYESKTGAYGIDQILISGRHRKVKCCSLLRVLALLDGTYYIFMTSYFDTQNGLSNDQSISVDFSLATRPSIKLSRKHKDTLIQLRTRDPRTKSGRSWVERHDLALGGPWIPDQNQTVSVRLFL